MKIIEIGNDYESKVYLDEKTKIIYKLDCQCQDFKFRRIKKVGEFADIKYYSEPCKHLKEEVESLGKIGYTLKKPEEIIGSEKLTPKLKEELLKTANFKCQDHDCEKKSTLEVHRKTRGSNGGKYNLKNCVVLCAEHHDLRHYGEFNIK